MREERQWGQGGMLDWRCVVVILEFEVCWGGGENRRPTASVLEYSRGEPPNS